MKWIVVYILGASFMQALCWRPSDLRDWLTLGLAIAGFTALPLNPEWFLKVAVAALP